MEVTIDFVGVSVGDTFRTFDELTEKIKQVQHASFVQLYMRDSRTIEAAKKRMPKIAAKANSLLRYHSLQYSCVFSLQYSLIVSLPSAQCLSMLCRTIFNLSTLYTLP